MVEWAFQIFVTIALLFMAAAFVLGLVVIIAAGWRDLR